MHWSQRYIGLAYEPGAFDCADLAARVRREVFGQAIDLPVDHGHEGGRGGRSAAIGENLPAYAERTSAPRDGDGVLLTVRGAAQHIGLFCEIASEAWVLHNHRRIGVQLVRVRDLARFGYAIEGFYRWI